VFAYTPICRGKRREEKVLLHLDSQKKKVADLVFMETNAHGEEEIL